MRIFDRIQELLEKYSDSKFNNLWSLCQSIVSDTNQHNKLIISQMRNYDLHDETHSQKVIEIIENLLGDKIKDLSGYELILIYLSAYIHDSAMALPAWEYDLLRAVEGTEEFYDNTLKFKICNDFKPKHSYSEAIKIIANNKKSLFSFEETSKYVFSKGTEDALIESLADLLCDYEEFRNGYTDELNSHKDSVADYINISQMIRSEFIRQTHHLRVVENVQTLKTRIIEAIDAYNADKFIIDLGEICKCHGENIASVFKLESQRVDWLNKASNIQFVAMLLRLGDVIHFSADRAPLSLFAEKRIEDETSFKHWNAKFQDLHYSISNINNTTTVKFTAFCSTPEVYFFIQDYINWIDNEINNYYSLKHHWEQIKLANISNYTINLSDHVDRSEINYDATAFQPKGDMHFVLNQSKILELLMGVQLYKDKYLCLREIYQNALDATKCIIAYNKANGITENLKIEFGIGEEVIDGIKQKYLYCLDHGTGMNEYIINNYLLHIGNSYYKSKDFSRKNTNWEFNVRPTSQFGIGILSSYMLADKIAITTVYYENSETKSFVLEGVNEHFYYINPTRLDTECIGKHGTIVKLFIKNKYCDQINADYIPKLPLLIQHSHIDKFTEYYGNREHLEGNLHYILSGHIGIPHNCIPVYIRDQNNQLRSLVQHNIILTPNNYSEIKKEDLRTIWRTYHYWGKINNPAEEAYDNFEFIENYNIKISTTNFELNTHISLPKKGFVTDNLHCFNLFSFTSKEREAMYVDGIYVTTPSALSEFSDILGLNHDGSSFNFIGSKRPLLSVDRNTIVEMPSFSDEIEEAKEKTACELKNIVYDHILKENIGFGDRELCTIFEIVMRFFPSITNRFLQLICETDLRDAQFPDELYTQDKVSIYNLIYGTEMRLENVNFMNYKEVSRRIILGKLCQADSIIVNDNSLSFKGGQEYYFPIKDSRFHESDLSLSSMVIKPDTWSGIYQEYDIVNTLWPIINPNLFDSLIDEYDNRQINKRCKSISETGNGVQGIAKLDPIMINPHYGIGIAERSFVNKNKCKIGKPDRIAHNFWLFELTDHGKLTTDDKKSASLFAYIAPVKLTSEEEIRLKEYESSDPEYVRGVKEGWSILFLGAMCEYVICPGIVSRDYIVSKIPDSFKNKDTSIKYYNTDGTETY